VAWNTAAGHDYTVASVAVPFISTPTRRTALDWAYVASGQTTRPPRREAV